jgi:hypothetical protein
VTGHLEVDVEGVPQRLGPFGLVVSAAGWTTPEGP